MEIRQQYTQLQEAIKIAQYVVEKAQIKIKELQFECPHTSMVIVKEAPRTEILCHDCGYTSEREKHVNRRYPTKTK